MFGSPAIARVGAVCAGLAMWVATPLAVRAADAPFAVSELTVSGRPTQAWTVPISKDCGAGARDLLVISIAGGPPDEERRLTVFPCGGGESITLRVPADVVAMDVFDVDGVPGGELLLVDRHGIRVLTPGDDVAGARRIAVPGLPLAPRSRGLSRVPVAADWMGDGSPTALLPTIDGGVLVDLRDGSTRPMALPVIAQYRTWDPDMPARVRKLAVAEYHWPVLMRGDDDGDGDTDLFALSRWEVAVFHAGEDGLPSEPSRRLPLRPFTKEEEMRFEATDVTYFAEDLDGDGLIDLMLHRISGGLMDGRSVTDIHLNPGAGARANPAPDAQLAYEDGFSGIEPMDLDGDGKSEIVETSFRFGVLQMVRALLTRQANIKVRILNADPEDRGRFESSWDEDMTFRINFGEGRIDGLFPSAEGDWNGDGRADLLYPDGKQKMSIRLGEAGKKGPRFGDRVASQPVPLRAGVTRIADLDGDGLEDWVAYDPRDASGRVFVFRNLGNLPGTQKPTPQIGSAP